MLLYGRSAVLTVADTEFKVRLSFSIEESVFGSDPGKSEIKAYNLSQQLRCKGIPVDLMVLLSGNHWLGCLPKERPCNVFSLSLLSSSCH